LILASQQSSLDSRVSLKDIIIDSALILVNICSFAESLTPAKQNMDLQNLEDASAGSTIKTAERVDEQSKLCIERFYKSV